VEAAALPLGLKVQERMSAEQKLRVFQRVQRLNKRIARHGQFLPLRSSWLYWS
jgi:hypothetical protein